MPGKAVDCASCYARAGGIFQDLAPELLKMLDNRKSLREYKRKETIFWQGDLAHSLYCVHSGLVKVSKIGVVGEETVIRILGPGEIAGYRPILADEPFAATAEALERSQICLLPRETFLFILRNSTDITFKVLAKLARELRESEEHWLSRAQETVTRRIARFVLSLAPEESGTLRGPSIPAFRLRRVDMAQAIGTTPETVSRTLRLFEEGGLISLTRTSISLKKPQELKRIAEGTA
jgi:CRP-like cAMP-binding protein